MTQCLNVKCFGIRQNKEPMNMVKEIYRLIQDIRYSYPFDTITTTGCCAVKSCKQSARSGSTCPDCLEIKLAKLVGKEKAIVFHTITKQAAVLANNMIEDCNKCVVCDEVVLIGEDCHEDCKAELHKMVGGTENG